MLTRDGGIGQPASTRELIKILAGIDTPEGYIFLKKEGIYKWYLFIADNIFEATSARIWFDLSSMTLEWGSKITSDLQVETLRRR